ncbi:MAG: TerB family tellurite resistance protein, partial [Proteobacteria bacterium]|nr:TerB family tellurite resistance protein [Pseudomonadota bacterium]
MSWWGKVIGGTFGFMLGGPLGALFGAAVGHQFDKGLERGAISDVFGTGDQERVQAAFFTALFSVMGHVAKADGRVSPDEIAMARSIMQQMALDQEQTRVAIDLFNQGKRDDFDLDAV